MSTSTNFPSHVGAGVDSVYCVIHKQTSLKRRGSNPNVLHPKDLPFEPVIEKDHTRYVPDPTYHSRTRRKLGRTRSNPERKVSTVTDLCSKENRDTAEKDNVENDKEVVIEQPGLNYFAYLGPGRDYSRQRSGTLEAFGEKPVIVTSTSVVLPHATSRNLYRDQRDAFEFTSSDECISRYDSNNYRIKSGYEDFIDCCSCMCCVKAVLYHCTKDSEGEGAMADHPCTCQGTRSECLGRWGTLGILAMFMPCLLCYLPLEGCNHCILQLKRCAGSHQNTGRK